VISITLTSNNPDDLTLRSARLLGEADYIFHDEAVAPEILVRARADAVRQRGRAPSPPPPGLCLYLTLATDIP
jgi:uroporphyrin-III C-methyltransferase / precorrin-2 dehydrogenase / sirohydrochlorin ferrochelatase